MSSPWRKNATTSTPPAGTSHSGRMFSRKIITASMTCSLQRFGWSHGGAWPFPFIWRSPSAHRVHRGLHHFWDSAKGPVRLLTHHPLLLQKLAGLRPSERPMYMTWWFPIPWQMWMVFFVEPFKCASTWGRSLEIIAWDTRKVSSQWHALPRSPTCDSKASKNFGPLQFLAAEGSHLELTCRCLQMRMSIYMYIYIYQCTYLFVFNCIYL